MKDSNIIDFESRFPEKGKAISFINQLQLLDLTQYELDDINDMIDDVFHMIPFGIAHIPKGTKLFRARKNNENQIFYNHCFRVRVKIVYNVSRLKNVAKMQHQAFTNITKTLN